MFAAFLFYMRKIMSENMGKGMGKNISSQIEIFGVDKKIETRFKDVAG